MAQGQGREMTTTRLDSFCFVADPDLHHKEVQVLSAAERWESPWAVLSLGTPWGGNRQPDTSCLQHLLGKDIFASQPCRMNTGLFCGGQGGRNSVQITLSYFICSSSLQVLPGLIRHYQSWASLSEPPLRCGWARGGFSRFLAGFPDPLPPRASKEPAS